VRIYTRIRKEDLSDFQTRLFERAQTRTDLEGYLPVLKASLKCKCQLRELVEMVLNGQLSGIAWAEGDMVFPNLFVDWKEAQEKRRVTIRREIGPDLLSIR